MDVKFVYTNRFSIVYSISMRTLLYISSFRLRFWSFDILGGRASSTNFLNTLHIQHLLCFSSRLHKIKRVQKSTSTMLKNLFLDLQMSVLELVNSCSLISKLHIWSRQMDTWGGVLTPVGTAKPLPSVTQKFGKPYTHWHRIWARINTLTGTNKKKGTLYCTTVHQSG